MNLFLIRVVDVAFEVYLWLIIIRVILSWFPVRTYGVVSRIVDFIYDVTEPFLAFFRKYIPAIPLGGVGLDISPIVAIIVLNFLRRIIISLLYQMAVL